MLKQFNDDQFLSEINKMINDVLCFTIMAKHCMGHRVISMIQFDMIDKTKNELLKGCKSSILILLDHKRNVLRIKFREGQVEYFGKMAIFSLTQLRLGGRKSTMGLNHVYVSIILLGLLSKFSM